MRAVPVFLRRDEESFVDVVLLLLVVGEVGKEWHKRLLVLLDLPPLLEYRVPVERAEESSLSQLISGPFPKN